MAKDKAGDFTRLAEARLPKVLEALRIFGHLTNRHAYECTPEQVKNYLDQIDEAVDAIRDGFGPELCPPRPTETLNSFYGLPDEPAPPPPPAPPPLTPSGYDVPEISQPDTDDFDAANRPATRYREDVSFTLNDWKADPTTLGYRAWVVEQHRLRDEEVRPFLRKDSL